MIDPATIRVPVYRTLRKAQHGVVLFISLIVLVAIAVFIASPTVTDAVMGVFNTTGSMLGSSSGS